VELLRWPESAGLKKRKQYRPELTDKVALKLAILGNPDLGELYTGCPVRRDGLAEVTGVKFLQGGPFPQ
jgi:hypothetical protein